MKTQIEKSIEFYKLHQTKEIFVIPNPWDLGSAKLLQHLGFKALASTGAGFAFAQGKSDLGIDTRDMLHYLSSLSNSTDIPVSADLQNGFGHAPEDMVQTILDAAATGVVGGSIDDATGDLNNPIYDIGLAKARIEVAAEAAKSLNFKFMLTGRAENYLYGRPDVKDTINRLQAYQDAGADVLFAPGIQSKNDIRSILESIDRPLNVIMGFQGVQLSLVELQQLGVARVSLGGSMARSAYGALVRYAKEILSEGTFHSATDAIPAAEINAIFASTKP